MAGLGTVREAVILSVLMNGEKYGREIRDEYAKRADKPMPIGSVYTTLGRMEKKGLVRSRMGEAKLGRRGNRPRYFRITGAGQAALDAFDLSGLPKGAAR